MPIPTPPSKPDAPARAPEAPRPPAASAGPDEFQPVAAALAFLLPGAGHAYLGEKRRAVLIAVGILGLFFSGLLIGGIDAVDRTQNPVPIFQRPTVNAWFYGQALVGPLTFAVDYIHQNHFKVIDPESGERRTPRPEIRAPDGTLIAPAEVRGPAGVAQPGQPGDRPPYSKAIGRMHELGVLFITIAGMLNLIAIMDAAMRPSRDTDRSIENARRFLGRAGQTGSARGEGAS